MKNVIYNRKPYCYFFYSRTQEDSSLIKSWMIYVYYFVRNTRVNEIDINKDPREIN